MLGRIEEDDAPVDRDGPRIGELIDGHPVRAAEDLPVAVSRDHVVVARQGPEPVLVVVVDGRVIPQPGVRLVRVVEEVGGKRVELHGAQSRAESRSRATGVQP